MSDHSKISIIGTGHVGSALGMACVTLQLADEIILVNRTPETARGHAADLGHAAAFVSRAIRVHAGDIADTAGSDVVVLTNSVPPKGDFENRMQLLDDNVELFRRWVPPLAEVNPEAVFIVVTNPVDVLSYVTWKLSGLSARQIIGSGTLIDSVRFRSSLSEYLQIHPDDIRAYILGEHGPTQFPLLSMSVTGGETLDGDADVFEIFEQTRGAGMEVYKLKGYTNYAVAMAVTLIIESVIRNSRRTLPISTHIDDFHGIRDVFLSLPAVVGEGGVQHLLHPRMNETEIQQWQASGQKIREAIQSIDTLS